MPTCKTKRSKLSGVDGRQNQHGHHGNQPPLSTTRLEKSRCAAKKRRDLEGEEIANLIQLLPFSEDVVSRLDKGSIFRLVINYIQMKDFIHNELQVPVTEERCSPEGSAAQSVCDDAVIRVDEGELMLEALNGFLIFLSKKGKILYASESIEKHTGIMSADMIGKPISPFIHTEDKKELAKQFAVEISSAPNQKFTQTMDVDCPNSVADDPLGEIFACPHERQFYMRMKSFTKKRGSKTRQAGFVLFQWSGRLRLLPSNKPSGFSIEGLLCLCRPVQPVPILEIRMDGNMFMSRHNMDMRFTFCDPRIVNLIGYEPSELIGKTAYQFHNPLDVFKISTCHSNLIVKGTSVSKYYRFLGKEYNWVWMQTRATIIYNTNNEAQYIVCMNYIISEEEGRRYMMLEQEQEGTKAKSTDIQGVMDTSGCAAQSAPSPEETSSSGYESVMECSDHEDVLMADDGKIQDNIIARNSPPIPPDQLDGLTSDGQKTKIADLCPETLVSDDLSGLMNCQPNVGTSEHIVHAGMIDTGDSLLNFVDTASGTVEREDLSCEMETMFEQVDPDGLLSDPAVIPLPTVDGVDILDSILDNSAEAGSQTFRTETRAFEDRLPFSPPSGYLDSLIESENSLISQGGNTSISAPPFLEWPSADSGPMVDSLFDSVLQPPVTSDSGGLYPQGSLHVRVGLLNPVDFSTSAASPNAAGEDSNDFPDDIVKLAVQFCEGIADEVMADTLSPNQEVTSSSSSLLFETAVNSHSTHASIISQFPDSSPFLFGTSTDCPSPDLPFLSQLADCNQSLQEVLGDCQIKGPSLSSRTQDTGKCGSFFLTTSSTEQNSHMSDLSQPQDAVDSNSFLGNAPVERLAPRIPVGPREPAGECTSHPSRMIADCPSRPMSELEKQLRSNDTGLTKVTPKTDKMAYKISQLEINDDNINKRSNSLLHKLLVGEMSKDTYTDMEHKPQSKSPHGGRFA